MPILNSCYSFNGGEISPGAQDNAARADKTGRLELFKMIIDCHGHYSTAPKALEAWRKRQIDGAHYLNADMTALHRSLNAAFRGGKTQDL